jgi:hypothetical protein
MWTSAHAWDRLKIAVIVQLLLDSRTPCVGRFAAPRPLFGSIIFVARLECSDLSFRLVAIDAVNLLDRAQQRSSLAADRLQLLLIELQPAGLDGALELRPMSLDQSPIHSAITAHQKRARSLLPIAATCLAVVRPSCGWPPTRRFISCSSVSI